LIKKHHLQARKCSHCRIEVPAPFFFLNNWRPDTGTGLSAPPGHATEQRSWKSMTVTWYFNCISMPGWMQSGQTLHKTHLVGGGTLVAQGISRVVCALALHDEVVADADGGPEVHQVVPCRRRKTLSVLAMLEVMVVDVPDAVRIVDGLRLQQSIHNSTRSTSAGSADAMDTFADEQQAKGFACEPLEQKGQKCRMRTYDQLAGADAQLRLRRPQSEALCTADIECEAEAMLQGSHSVSAGNIARQASAIVAIVRQRQQAPSLLQNRPKQKQRQQASNKEASMPQTCFRDCSSMSRPRLSAAHSAHGGLHLHLCGTFVLL